MRTLRGTPECSLPNGRRLSALVTYTCKDEDSPYIETTFVDVASGRIEVLLRPNADITTVFPIGLVPKSKKSFPRTRAWFSVIFGRPFGISAEDVFIHESCLELRIRGYFDAAILIQFDRHYISDAIEAFTTGQNGYSMGNSRSTIATNSEIHQWFRGWKWEGKTDGSDHLDL